jgi:hypothetical protein
MERKKEAKVLFTSHLFGEIYAMIYLERMTEKNEILYTIFTNCVILVIL